MPPTASALDTLVHRALPHARAIHISVLAGGITNLNYRVVAEGETYVLRVPGANTNLLGIDRAREIHNQRVAASVGAAPEVVAFIEPEGCTLSRFVVGAKITRDSMRARANLVRVCESLHRFHDGPAFVGEFNAFRVCENYRALARAYGVAEPKELARLFDCANEIERACYRSTPFAPRPCHNDLLNENFLDDGARIWILDWEYAGMGELYFDLANFAAQHQFDDDGERNFLEIYFGAYAPRAHARLKLFRILSDAREAMWGIVQSGISRLDFDFKNYAQEFLERALAQTTDQRYSEWLERTAAV